MIGRLTLVSALASVVLASGAARADVDRCSHVDGSVATTITDLPNLKADTGWFPGSSPVQFHIVGQVIGQTTVAMNVTPTACWGEAMQLTIPGVAQGGLLDSEYGAALDVYGRIHASVLGYSVDWTGKIPLPSFLPTDLLMAGTTSFEPTGLAGAVSVTSNPTSPVTVISTNVLGALIGISGISGGLDIVAQGRLTTSYATSSLSIGSGAVTTDGGHVDVARPSSGFGASLDTALSASGTVRYDPAITFSAVFDISLLGYRIVNVNLASITLPLPTIDRQITLDGSKLSLPLPHLDQVPTSLGFASGASQTLKLHNAGKAPLQIEVASAPSGVTANGITIAPGADGSIQVTAADASAASGTLELATNDPNNATLAITLDAAQSGQTTEPTGQPEPAGGCAAGGGHASALLAVGLLALRRRRRV